MQEGKRQEEARELLLAHLHTLVAQATAIETTPDAKIGEAAPIEKVSSTKVQQQVIAVPTVSETTSQAVRIIPCIKQARYLSNWKVKRNGRLDISKQRHQNCLPTLMPCPVVMPSIIPTLRE